MFKPSILKLVSRSPIKGLRKHMQYTAEAGKMLVPFFDSIVSQDVVKGRAIFEEIIDLEHKADECKRQCRIKTHRNLILSIPRGDTLALLHVQEKAINLIRDVAGIFVGRKPVISPVIIPSFREFVQKVEQSISQAYLAVCELDDLVDYGFSKIFKKHVLQAANELDHLEHQADALEEQLRHLFFIEEQTDNAIELMFIYQIIERLGWIADISEEIGSRLVILVSR
ncbi:MAG: hypothetical protein CMF41_04630 [Legionellales bacterium]|jgi:predicted phosphate transport protein (TIGR00153 family)|nr:hypothetical protein [Legionellales bacterium]OUX64870.1 MAG: hypothetical protein CBE41_02545 [Gammaproteobacteria bacterium TMED281]